MNYLISPSLLAANFSKLGEELRNIEEAGADMLHLDVMDGHFVPNISYGIPVIKALRKETNLIFDVHLMISDPYFYIEQFVDAGADLITFHIESLFDSNNIINKQDVLNLINKIKSYNCKVGISIKPATDVEIILDYIEYIDMVLVMSVEPGFGGQGFMPESVEKIKKIRRLYPKLDIQVDGGINAKTAELVKDAGANILVAGTAVFGSDDYKKAIHDLKK